MESLRKLSCIHFLGPLYQVQIVEICRDYRITETRLEELLRVLGRATCLWINLFNGGWMFKRAPPTVMSFISERQMEVVKEIRWEPRLYQRQ